jgi:hypothetical protein
VPGCGELIVVVSKLRCDYKTQVQPHVPSFLTATRAEKVTGSQRQSSGQMQWQVSS